MSTTQPSPLEHNIILRPTACRICGKEFPGKSLATAAILGDNPQAKIQQVSALISPLMKHLGQKHPEQLRWAQMSGGEWGGLLSLNFFTCDEPLVERSRDETRWKIHQMTTRVAVTDERIEERLRLAYLTAMAHEVDVPVDQIPPAMADELMKTPSAIQILKTMREMRDVLQERDRYSKPKVPVMDGAPPTEEPPKGPSAN